MKLSIIIPVYNTREYLAACLDSVLDNACNDYEIVIVNDGSTADSGIIAAGYAGRYPDLIRVITTENGGLGVDLCFEASGAPAAVPLGIDVLRKIGLRKATGQRGQRLSVFLGREYRRTGPPYGEGADAQGEESTQNEQRYQSLPSGPLLQHVLFPGGFVPGSRYSGVRHQGVQGNIHLLRKDEKLFDFRIPVPLLPF